MLSELVLSLIGKNAETGENLAKGGTLTLRFSILCTRSSEDFELVVRKSKMMGISPTPPVPLSDTSMETLGVNGGDGRHSVDRAKRELELFLIPGGGEAMVAHCNEHCCRAAS